MLFRNKILERIKDGAITLAFRRWETCRVTTDSLLNTEVGLIKITGVSEVQLAGITLQEANSAGYDDPEALETELNKWSKKGTIFKIKLEYHGADPRIELRNTPTLSDEAFRGLQQKLQRLDKNSKTGNWTTETLNTIKDHPNLNAGNLSELLSRDKEGLKLNIRKLKNLGLTISRNPGYEISPLGSVYLGKLKTE